MINAGGVCGERIPTAQPSDIPTDTPIVANDIEIGLSESPIAKSSEDVAAEPSPPKTQPDTDQPQVNVPTEISESQPSSTADHLWVKSSTRVMYISVLWFAILLQSDLSQP